MCVYIFIVYTLYRVMYKVSFIVGECVCVCYIEVIFGGNRERLFTVVDEVTVVCVPFTLPSHLSYPFVSSKIIKLFYEPIHVYNETEKNPGTLSGYFHSPEFRILRN